MGQSESAMRLLPLSQSVQVAEGMETERLCGEANRMSRCESCRRDESERKVTHNLAVPLCTAIFLQQGENCWSDELESVLNLNL